MMKEDLEKEILALIEERGLVPAGELAKLLHVSPPAISNWRKRFSDFPQPVLQVYQLKLYIKQEVLDWAENHKKTHGGSRMPELVTVYRLARRLSASDQLELAHLLTEGR